MKSGSILKSNEYMHHNINDKTTRLLMLHIRVTLIIDSNDKQLKRQNTVLKLKLLFRYLIIYTLKENKRHNIKGWVRIHSNNKRCIDIQDRFTHLHNHPHIRIHINIMYSHITYIITMHTQLGKSIHHYTNISS